jgi:hypothetical protein
MATITIAAAGRDAAGEPELAARPGGGVGHRIDRADPRAVDPPADDEIGGEDDRSADDGGQRNGVPSRQ